VKELKRNERSTPIKPPALLRDLSKNLESNSGIDAAGRKGNCSLTTIGERPTFNSRKTTGPMIRGSAIILPLKFGLPSSSDVRWPFFSSFWATSFIVKCINLMEDFKLLLIDRLKSKGMDSFSPKW